MRRDPKATLGKLRASHPRNEKQVWGWEVDVCPNVGRLNLRSAVHIIRFVETRLLASTAVITRRMMKIGITRCEHPFGIELITNIGAMTTAEPTLCFVASGHD